MTLEPWRAVGGSLAGMLTLCAASSVWGATPATMAALPLQEVAGRGARVPFVEYEAENAGVTGTVIGPDRRFGALAAEASGRRAVRLDAPGQYVEFTLAKPANALVVRYAVPDTPDGRGLEATLGVYVAGERIASLPVTSRYGWLYGRYPFSNNPADGGAHHFYDDARLRLGRTLKAGDKLRLMVGPGDRAPWYVIDVVDFEQAPAPKPPPLGALPVIAFGADPSGVRDSSVALQQAIRAGQAQKRPVWLPPGEYRVTRHLLVDRVELDGAGPWYSVLHGPGVGVYGRSEQGQGRAVTLRDFAIVGEVTERNDHAQLNGIGGALGAGSTIDNLWIQHTKVGLWLDGPMDGLEVRNLRLLDLMADGLNFHGGVSHAVVEDCFIRNAGDDGLAMWSKPWADHHDVFRHNTIIAPILANGIAIYGGHDIEVSGNLVADTLTEGGGLHVGNRFSAVPASGEITLADNLVVRSGSFDPHWRFGVGALWFYALDAPLTAHIRVRDTDLIDSSYPAVQFYDKRITSVSLQDIRIRNAGTFALQLQAPGEARISDVTASGLGAAGVFDCHSGFVVEDGGGNVGWSSRYCGPMERSSASRGEVQ